MWNYHYPLTEHEKWIISLRICFRAGYTRYFEKHVQEYQAKGLTCKEMLDGCIDEKMRKQLLGCLK